MADTVKFWKAELVTPVRIIRSAASRPVIHSAIVRTEVLPIWIPEQMKVVEERSARAG